jgi:DNA-binding response OmpR family regulator
MDPSLEGIKIIIMSGYLSEEEVEEMKEEGIDEYIPKPFDLEEVKAMIRRLLELD